MQKLFSDCTYIEKDELRKCGLRVLTHVYKRGKSCSTCGWSNPRHLCLGVSATSLRGPLKNVPQGKLLDELSKRVVICAKCRRLHPPAVPPSHHRWWRLEPMHNMCVDCGAIGKLGSTCFLVDITYSMVGNHSKGPVLVPSKLCKESKKHARRQQPSRCTHCAANFKGRVQQAHHTNTRLKLDAGRCEFCSTAVTKDTVAAFDWDHLDRNLKFKSVSTLVFEGCSPSVVQREVAKCRLLCVFCHINWTTAQLNYSDVDAHVQQAFRRAAKRTFEETAWDLASSEEDNDNEEL